MAYNRRKRKQKRDITEGQAHIHSTFNNTIVTITDKDGGVISWASSGTVGFNCLFVIFSNFFLIPQALAVIVKQAFFPEAVAGGVFGTIIMGLRRSVQCNEAGTGSAPIAYATVKTKEPVSQGFVSLIEPFLTGLLCLLTAFVITITNNYHVSANSISGIEMTSKSFSSVIPFFPYILAVVVILFALSTIISWAYYGQKAWNFLFGEGYKRTLMFQIAYCAIIVLGSVMNLRSVINITDAMMISMSVPNIITMYILAPEIKRDLKEYAKRHKIAMFINSKWYDKDLKV